MTTTTQELSFYPKCEEQPDSDIISPQALKKAKSTWNDPSVTKMLSNSGDSSAFHLKG